jgi:mycoredoxin
VNSAAGALGPVRVYWRPGCPYCAMLRLGLRKARVPAEWVNIWEDPAAAAEVRAITGGDETVPAVVVGTQALVNPSARRVAAAVREARPATLLPAGRWASSWRARMAGLLARRRPWLGAHR